MKKIFILLSTIASLSPLHAINPIIRDTIYTEIKNDIVILSSTKETNSLKSLPAAVSIFSQKNLESLQVHNLKDLSSFVPNYFVADYGSKMTAPLYIRGIGARSGTQTVSMYVDNIPYFNTTSFDIELLDIQRVEVLRGTQATLYGRNAMGGILNIYTYSPISYSGTHIKLGGGSYGQLSGNASHYQKINNKMGISAGIYYKQDDGYFINTYTGKKADHSKNVGGRSKFAWDINNQLSANYSLSFDYVDQGAFPYMNTSNKEVSYNSESYYKRNLLTNGIALRYKGNGYEINSTTGYQYLNDEMNMDQDYTPLSMFTINQRQNQHSLSQEITLKSVSNSNYQWSNGAFAFYDYLKTTPPVYMLGDGIQNILQAQMDALKVQYPNMPAITFTDKQIDLNGIYKTPTAGAAIFHQSTFNHILDTEGLSFTAGLRLDYEHTKLDYNASTEANFKVGAYPGSYLADTAIIGTASTHFLELLPKAVLKYQINPKSYIYTSASRGYKAGGHNIQLFADLLQEALTAKMMAKARIPAAPSTDATTLQERISFKPEYSWNYELGGQVELIENSLSATFAAYYMDVQNVQITQFMKSGGGRLVSNAGKAVSKGLELGLKTRPCKGFFLYANYGLSDARFKEYTTKAKNSAGVLVDVDYSNHHIPFAPLSTFSLGANISYDLKNSRILDQISFDANYSGVGKIYWNEANNSTQDSYGTMDTRITLAKNNFTLEFWGKNIFDTNYNAFMFESMKNNFAQQGKPARWGASLKIML